MEAKDTVIKYQCKHRVIAGSSEWHMIDGYNMGAEAQAEISFKAGIREAVEWLKGRTHGYYHGPVTQPEGPRMDGFCCTDEEWQAKLKEWGIDNEVTNA